MPALPQGEAGHEDQKQASAPAYPGRDVGPADKEVAAPAGCKCQAAIDHELREYRDDAQGSRLLPERSVDRPYELLRKYRKHEEIGFRIDEAGDEALAEGDRG
jgi:hypothetical protein